MYTLCVYIVHVDKSSYGVTAPPRKTARVTEREKRAAPPLTLPSPTRGEGEKRHEMARLHMQKTLDPRLLTSRMTEREKRE